MDLMNLLITVFQSKIINVQIGAYILFPESIE